jgi:cobyrinic acid a,c-diamide synthase
MKSTVKAIVIAGTRSGAGKTTVTLGLMAALRRRGLQVAPFKVGPDFIDPGHHRRITGCPSRNLDGWMLSRQVNRDTFQRHAAGCDVAVIEGVMGLFDGFSGTSEDGSTAQMAKWLGIPVLVVVDAASMARSAAALVMGFEAFDPQLCFAGVLFNRIGSKRHLATLQEALEGHVRMPCLGGVPRRKQVHIPERHLGLVTGEDHPLSRHIQAQLADLLEAAVDLDTLLARLPEVSVASVSPPRRVLTAKSKVPIAVARDNAFCFYYPENLELLAAAGAELVPFSPLRGDALPPGTAGLYLGGGYPELFAADLCRNRRLREQIRLASRDGLPIYAECGGFMFLCRRIEDLEGERFDMCGCFAFKVRMARRLRSLGYREVRMLRDNLLGPAGTRVRGHEFHYSYIEGDDPATRTLYEVSDRGGHCQRREGFLVNRTLGSYFHLHFGSCPPLAQAFVDSCRRYRQGSNNHET